MAFTIRKYQQGDLEACRLLWIELVERHRMIYEDPTIGGENPETHFDRHLSKVGDENIWVAEMEGKVIGMVGLMRNHDDEVEPLVVTSDYRSQGAGGALLEHAVAMARSMGIRFLSIKPVARNLEAISLFYRKGFDKLGHIEMVMDLQQEAGIVWRPGPEIDGHQFEI